MYRIYGGIDIGRKARNQNYIKWKLKFEIFLFKFAKIRHFCASLFYQKCSWNLSILAEKIE